MNKSVLISLGIISLMMTACSPKEDTTPTDSSDKHVAGAAPASASASAAQNSEPAPLTQAFIDQKVAAARNAINTASNYLKTEAGSAEDETACHSKISAVTTKVSASQNMKITHVSLGSGHEPIGWTKRVLEQFTANPNSSQLEHHELVEINGKHVFRYMAAITNGSCLPTHTTSAFIVTEKF